MKTIILFITCLCIISCDKQMDNDSVKSNQRKLHQESTRFNFKIASLDHEGIRIIDPEHVSSLWETNMNEVTGKVYNIHDLEIQSDGAKYRLVGKSNHGMLGVELIKDGLFFYEAKVFGGSLTVTCSGCVATSEESVGMCEPKVVTGGWYCTFCSVGDCVKTSIAKSSSFLSGN